MSYKTLNKMRSPKFNMISILKEKGIYSEFPKDGFRKITDNEKGFYFSQELLEKDFVLSDCITARTSQKFANLVGYSRPRINNYIERFMRIVFFDVGFYDMEKLKIFISENIKEYTETRGQPNN